MKVGIIGLGFVGNAMMQSFMKVGYSLENNNLHIYDKFKNGGIGSFDSILDTNIVFLALPTLYSNEKEEYDLTAINETLERLKEINYKGIIVLKSTITPGTTFELEDKYGLGLIHNPEFLTARTAEHDFHYQSHIVLGKGKLVTKENYEIICQFFKDHYALAELSKCSADESESMKIYCNSFYALKVQFFTELYLSCQKDKIDFENVKKLMLKNNWINPMHTNVPGPDGNISYGGMCFPKDSSALLSHMKKKNTPHLVLDGCVKERNEMRKD